jgi:hypothetical protein
MNRRVLAGKALGERIGDMGKPIRDGDGDGKCREYGGKFIPCPPGIDADTVLGNLNEPIEIFDGVDLDLFDDEYELERSAVVYDWQQWEECRSIRQEAYKIVSGSESTADPYLRRSEPNFFGDPAIARSKPSRSEEVFRSEARYLLNRLVENLQQGEVRNSSLYRAMELPSDPEAVLSSLEEGKIVDIPLMATATEARQGTNNFLSKYGRDILLKIDGTNVGIEGDALATLASEQDEDELLNYLEMLANDWINFPSDEGSLTDSADQLLELIQQYEEARRLQNYENLAKTKKELLEIMDQYDLQPDGMHFAGDELDENHPDYYERIEDPSTNPLREVITGGRFKVSKVEDDPSGTYKRIVTLSHIAVFDPRQPGSLKPIKGAR